MTLPRANTPTQARKVLLGPVREVPNFDPSGFMQVLAKCERCAVLQFLAKCPVLKGHCETPLNKVFYASFRYWKH